jgi:hypothetical protein
VIDGVAYAEKAESAEIVVDKQNLNKITITSTDGDTYEQSYVDYEVTDGDYEQDIMELEKNYTYIVYKDKFGYVATATQATQAGEFVLLNEAYYGTSKAGAEYAVQAYVDGALSTYDVNARSTANFINGTNNDNGWQKLNSFAGHDTTIATYTLDDDGVMSLNVVESAFNKKTVRMVDLASDTVLDGTNKALKGTSYVTGTAKNAKPYGTEDVTNKDITTVNVRSDTVYYYVYTSGNQTIVKTYTGYANAPKTTNESVTGMYAVATKASNGSYWVANVVVVELASFNGAAENVFVYNYPENVNTLKHANIDIIQADGTTTTVTVSNPEDVAYGPAYLYGNATDGYTIKQMPVSAYAKNNLLAGKVTTAIDVKDADYIGITGQYSDDTAYATETRLYDLDGVYYTYSIAKTSSIKGNGYDKGTLTDSDADDVLVSKVTVTDKDGKKTPNQDNLVFVSYDNRGNIIYAISFDQDYADVVDDTATDVYKNLRVDAPGTTLTLDVRTSNVVTKNTDNTVTGSTVTATDGTATFKVTPAKGYKLSNVNVVLKDGTVGKVTKGDADAGDGSVEITVSNLTAADTAIVTATVTQLQYTVTDNSSDAATVTINTEANGQGGKYLSNTDVNFSVAAPEHKAVTAVKINGVALPQDDDGTYTIKSIAADSTITVETDDATYAVEVEVQDSTGAKLSALSSTKAVKYTGAATTISLTDDTYVYVYGGALYAANANIDIGTITENKKVVIKAYPKTITVSLSGTGTEAATEEIKGATWSVAASTATITNDLKPTITLSITPTGTSTGAVTVKYKVNGGDEASLTIDSGVSTVQSKEIQLDAPLTATTVTIEITSIA